MDGFQDHDHQLADPPQPGETPSVYGTALLMLGAIGIILSLCGIVVGVIVLAFWLVINMVGSNKIPFTLQWALPLMGAIAIGVLSWIVIKIGARVRV